MKDEIIGNTRVITISGQADILRLIELANPGMDIKRYEITRVMFDHKSLEEFVISVSLTPRFPTNYTEVIK